MWQQESSQEDLDGSLAWMTLLQRHLLGPSAAAPTNPVAGVAVNQLMQLSSFCIYKGPPVSPSSHIHILYSMWIPFEKLSTETLKPTLILENTLCHEGWQTWTEPVSLRWARKTNCFFQWLRLTINLSGWLSVSQHLGGKASMSSCQRLSRLV